MDSELELAENESPDPNKIAIKIRMERDRERINDLRNDKTMVEQVRCFLIGDTNEEPDLVSYSASDVVLLMLDMIDEIEEQKAEAKQALSEVDEYRLYKDLTAVLSKARKTAKVYRRVNVTSLSTFGDLEE